MTAKLPPLSYYEREAVQVVRKLLLRKPEIAAYLLDGHSKELATTVLLKVRDELNQLLAVSRAFSAAAGELAKKAKEAEDAQSQNQ